MECRKELSGVKRREQIIDNLREHGEVTVKILSNQFGVSEMTIRRDLHLLEEQGYATIHYGGAALLDRQNIGCQSFSLRKGKESENKRRIAKKAASFIREGDVLFMDTSTTVLEILTYMPAFRVKINKAFFGSTSYEPDFGTSAAEEIEAAVKKCVIENSDENYLLIDHSKMGKRNFVKWGDTDNYTAILSDEELDIDWRTKIARNGGKLILC